MTAWKAWAGWELGNGESGWMAEKSSRKRRLKECVCSMATGV